MSNSQNKKNEQQNNLCTTLTEKWKKGELERGRYYIKYRGNYMSDNWHGDCWEDSWSEYVEEVLAPVPSYEEWQELSKQRNQLIRDVKDLAYIQEENQQLKELLKYCHYYIINTPVYPQGDDAKQMEIHKLSDQITNAIGEKK